MNVRLKDLGSLFVAGFLLVVNVDAGAALLAFPEAQGFGRFATGGRAGTVYRVTTLANSGAGSFRDAVSQPNRIIVFDVGGYITLSSEVALSPNLTIAGQSAPGGGIAIRGAEVSTGSATNLIIRHVRFRPGSSADEGAHCINIRGTNVILDQVSLEFGPWNNVGGVNANQVTIQRSLIADPIGQQFGAHMERLGGTITWYQNVFANGHNRQPLAKINTVFINNVVYNYEAGYTCGDTSGHFSHDIIGNYFITGPATDTAGNDFYQIGGNQSIYESGNLRDSDRDGLLDGVATLVGEGTPLGAPWSGDTAGIPTVNAATAFRRNVSLAGAWPRDDVDYIILNEVRSVGLNGPNPLPNSQTITGLGENGFGLIGGGPAPFDVDQDGMPDYWEGVTGSDPNVPDAMVLDGQGYARIEHFLNWLAEPHAIRTISTRSYVDVALWPYAHGFTNAAPTYFVDQPTNGTVVLTNGQVAHFFPTPGFHGLCSFRFAVVSSDGLNHTNLVVVLVPAGEAPSNLQWRGDGVSNIWSTASSNWWKGALVAFRNQDNVRFDDGGSNTPLINVTGAVAPGGIYVTGESDYTFGGTGEIFGPTTLTKDGGGKLTLLNRNTFTSGTLISGGTVQIGDGVSLNASLNGDILNYGKLIFANAAPLQSSAGIAGNGPLTKMGAGTLTFGGGMWGTNLTTILEGALEFAGDPPRGDVTNSAILRFRPATSIAYTNSIRGSGSFGIDASGQTVTLSGANTHSGGTTNHNGTIRLNNAQALGSGPLTYLAGAVHVGNGIVISNTFIVPSSTSDSMMDVASGSGTWAGDIVLNGGAQFRPSGINGTLRLTGNGALGTRNLIIPRGTVEFAENAVFSASGTATAFGRNSTGNSVNVRVRDNASVTFGAFSLGGGQGSGGTLALTIQDNANFSTGTSNFELHNSTAAAAVSVLNLNGGTLTVGGFTKTRTGATQFSAINHNGGTLRASQNNVSFLPAVFGLTNFVKIGGAVIDVGGFNISVLGSLFHDPALGSALDGGLIKKGGGTLTISFRNMYTGPTIVQAGALSFFAPPATPVFSSSSIEVAAGALLDWTSLAPLAVTNGGKLSGNGSVRGAFRIGSGAILAPGSNGIGGLTFSNVLSLLNGSSVLMQLSKAPLTNDWVKLHAALTNGGALVITNLGGELGAGDSFRLFEAANYFGAFQSVVLPPLNPGLVWETNELNSAGAIRVASLPTPPAPVFSGATSTGDQLIFGGSNGQPGSLFYILATTNIALPVANWQRIATNQFNANGFFQVTNPVDSAVSQQFLRLELP